MKNIQIIDGAKNCSYDIFCSTDEEFYVLFPEPGQDIEFIEDVLIRLGNESLDKIMAAIWKRQVRKPDVAGIHGTLFYELLWKKKYYPTKNSEEMIVPFENTKNSL